MSDTVERRKTAHLTAQFKEYNREQVKNLLGLDLDEENAWTLFKILYKLPMRFLAQLPVEEVDKEGNKSVPLPGVGRFKIMKTMAQGSKKPMVPDGIYPRFKFYPANTIECEVEHYYGIADTESKEAYDKAMTSEEKKVEELVKAVAKLISGGSVVPQVVKQPMTLDEVIRSIVKEELLKGGVAKVVKSVVADAIQPNIEADGTDISGEAPEKVLITESGFPEDNGDIDDCGPDIEEADTEDEEGVVNTEEANVTPAVPDLSAGDTPNPNITEPDEFDFGDVLQAQDISDKDLDDAPMDTPVVTTMVAPETTGTDIDNAISAIDNFEFDFDFGTNK